MESPLQLIGDHSHKSSSQPRPKYGVPAQMQTAEAAYQNAMMLLHTKFQVLLSGRGLRTSVSFSPFDSHMAHTHPGKIEHDMRLRAQERQVVHDKEIGRMWAGLSNETAQEILFWEHAFIVQIREIVEDMIARLVLDSVQRDVLVQRGTVFCTMDQYKEEEMLRRSQEFTSTARQRTLTVDVPGFIYAMKAWHNQHGSSYQLFSGTGSLDYYIVEFLKT